MPPITVTKVRPVAELKVKKHVKIKELVQVNLKRTECKVIKLKLRKRKKINLLQTERFSDFVCTFAMSFGDFAILLFAALR